MVTVHIRPASTWAAAIGTTIDWTASLDGSTRPEHADDLESDGTVADATRHRFGVPGSNCRNGETIDAAHVRKPYANVWAISSRTPCSEYTDAGPSSPNDAAIPKH